MSPMNDFVLLRCCVNVCPDEILSLFGLFLFGWLMFGLRLVCLFGFHLFGFHLFVFSAFVNRGNVPGDRKNEEKRQ